MIPQETARFTWDDSYSVSDEEIDKQHKTMLDIANSVPDNINEPSVKQMVMRLYDYVLTHLIEEEELMKEKGYPGLTEHSRIHGRLIIRLNRMISDGITTNEELHELKKFIYEWTSRHILREDKNFACFIRESEANKP